MKIPPRPGPLAQALGSLQSWLNEYGVKTARLCIGSVYFWFGALRFSPVVSHDEAYLPGRVISALTLHLLDSAQGSFALGFWECFIGFSLVAGIALRLSSFLMFAHLLVMFLPMALWPRHVWYLFPFGLTLRGQIILDNLVMIACGMVLASSVPRRSRVARSGRLGRWMHDADDRASRWMGRHGVLFLRIAMGVLYVWFGALKYFTDGGSGFSQFTGRIIERITFGLTGPVAGAAALATLECVIGLGLLSGRLPRTVLALILLHLGLMCTPLFFEPETIWLRFPFVLTLTGKFLIRHLALYAAAIVIVSSVAQRAHGWSALVNPFQEGSSGADKSDRSHTTL